MAYVAVTGGQEAIAASIALLREYRCHGDNPLDPVAMVNRMGLLIDKIMGEAGLYCPDHAALALLQSEGSVEEAVFLLRAYRSSLTRAYYSIPLDGAQMRLLRRISAAYKDVPGGQMLGATYDYTHRLLDFSLLSEHEDTKIDTASSEDEECNPFHALRVSDLLRAENIIVQSPTHAKSSETVPEDITQNPLRFPTPRSARLQVMARAESGFLGGLAYANLRGFGQAHPTVGELRTGWLEVNIDHPLLDGQTLHVGEIQVTEVESFFSLEEESQLEELRDDPLKRMERGQGDKADTSTNALQIGVGYGLTFGRSDQKAISMSIMDFSLEKKSEGILSDDEFVLLHGDCLEMSGFISHLKLPHYVTFQSKLDRVRSTRKDTEACHA
ncbi:MAG: carbon-phosphorus lyase complex subunit PhnI [Symbiobacteriaceae bacterium]|nr:carbon-phosphorus lyase complex subunit PhnI [Symbiobacteriaceae bacterium]